MSYCKGSPSKFLIFNSSKWRLLNETKTLPFLLLLQRARTLGMRFLQIQVLSVQFSSVAQSCLTLCNPMNCSTPRLSAHHQLPEFTKVHVHRVSDAIQPSHPLSSPSPAPNPSRHQSLFQWVNSLHEVAKVLEFQLYSIKYRWPQAFTKLCRT